MTACELVLAEHELAIMQIVETVADSRFEAPRLPPAEYRLEISKPGYMPSMDGGKKPNRKFRLKAQEAGAR